MSDISHPETLPCERCSSACYPLAVQILQAQQRAAGHAELGNALLRHRYERRIVAGNAHGPLAGEPDDVWWFGFDCMHAGLSDHVPGLFMTPRLRELMPGVYRDLAYVHAETERLAEQLAALVGR